MAFYFHNLSMRNKHFRANKFFFYNVLSDQAN